ncbi:glycosyltransferase family 4 protein [Peribacillus sp. FSL M8-0224]|uniref:glycosyltransferase family 4 protein n=1 Tax=Peribacillus sp. FSL M8-0224 TaxID=2921568 RepID=UPI0030FCB055
MRILFICTGKHNDLGNWSGTVSSLYQTIRKISPSVEVVEDFKPLKIIKLIYLLLNKLSSKRYLIDRNRFVLKVYSSKIKRTIKQKKYDVIFSTSSLPVTYLKTDIPIVFYTDATFKNMVNYYEEFTNLSSYTLREGDYLEKLSLNNSALAIYSSEWAKNSAINDYGCSKENVKVLNFGLNIQNKLNSDDIHENLKSKINDKEIKLFFMGVDFKRKGGYLALDIVKYINSKGYKAKLYIAGSEPLIDDEYKKYTEVIGFLNKAIKEDQIIIDKMYKQSHFFLLPTKSEAYGIVFAEASSYGLPSITTNTGGVPSVVKNTKNGYCLDVSASPKEFGDIIISNFINKKEYLKLSMNTYKEYQDKLNWDYVESKINNYIESLI